MGNLPGLLLLTTGGNTYGCLSVMHTYHAHVIESSYLSFVSCDKSVRANIFDVKAEVSMTKAEIIMTNAGACYIGSKISTAIEWTWSGFHDLPLRCLWPTWMIWEPCLGLHEDECQWTQGLVCVVNTMSKRWNQNAVVISIKHFILTQAQCVLDYLALVAREQIQFNLSQYIFVIFPIDIALCKNLNSTWIILRQKS